MQCRSDQPPASTSPPVPCAFLCFERRRNRNLRGGAGQFRELKEASPAKSPVIEIQEFVNESQIPTLKLD
jgi:hypothetical protein